MIILTVTLVLVFAVAVLSVLVAVVSSRRKLKMDLEAAREVFVLANDAVLVVDIVRGRILEANPATCRLLACTEKELLGRTLPELHPPEAVARSAEIIADVWEHKGLTYSDVPFVTSTGDRVDVEVSASVITFRGEPAILIYARDIRERVRAEGKIRAYGKDLEASNLQLHEMQAQLVQSEKMASLGNLAAGIAHEINTPIGALASNTDVARRALEIIQKAIQDPQSQGPIKDDKKAQRAMTLLVELNATNQIASARISEIVKSLRNFARLDEADRKRVDIHEGIESTLTLLKHELKDRVRVHREYAALPEIECFPHRLNQVFMNLLVNAIHAIEGEGDITIRTRAHDGYVLLEFEDTGKGIPPENLRRIFDPGFTTKGVGVGTGLGLSISYRIVESHKGTIEVKSEVGKGSTFSVRLPI